MHLAISAWLLAVHVVAAPRPPQGHVPAADSVPAIERAAPPAGFPAELRDSVRFGYVRVPQDHDDPSAGTLRIAFVVLPARGRPSAPDPVVFIPGGPGMSVIEPWAATAARAARIDLLRERRDFVILEPRGHGLSEPHACPELNGTAPLLGDAPAAEQALASRLVACRERMTAAGVRLAALNSIQAARDLDVLRRVLGAPQLNLLGVSYGSRIAAEAMRTIPGSVRAAALVGPVPPGHARRRDQDRLAVRGLRALFDRCRAQPACRDSYPTLGADYDSVVARAAHEPQVVSTPVSTRFPEGRLVLDGRRLGAAIASLLFERQLTTAVPLLVHTLASRGVRSVAHLAPALAERVADDAESFGTFLAFECNDFPIGIDDDAALRGRCSAWIGPEFGDRRAAPLRSDVPALVMAGELDPRTPPDYARVVAAGLSSAHLFVVPWVGHEYGLPCLNRMQRDFFASPALAPDASCLDSLPPITFVTGVVPSRWVGAAAMRAAASPLGVAAPVAALLLMLPLVAWLPLRTLRKTHAPDIGAARPVTLLLWLATLVGSLVVLGTGAAIVAAGRQSFLVPAIGVLERWRWVLALPWLALALALAALALAIGRRRDARPTHAVVHASAWLGLAAVLGMWAFLSNA